MERYKVFLGSEIAKSYDEAKNFTLARVDEYTEFNHKELFSTMLMLSESTIIAGVDKSNGKVVLLPVRVPNKK